MFMKYKILIIKLIFLLSRANSSNDQSLFLITFGSKSDHCINRTASDFNFSTEHDRVYGCSTRDGQYDIVNSIPDYYKTWHGGALDYTENDIGGYMLLVDQGEKNEEIFNLTIDNLCIGLQYEFSTYATNIIKKSQNQRGPYIRFEVRSAVNRTHTIAKSHTDEILAYDNMTWIKFGVSFQANYSSVVLLMFVDIRIRDGNDVAIDDVELRVNNANGQVGYCPSNQSANTIQSHGIIGPFCGICNSRNHTFDQDSIFLITFDAGSELCSNKTPAYFNFSTTYQQHVTKDCIPQGGFFSFSNSIPQHANVWHNESLDHTENDTNGYMYLVNVGAAKNIIFSYNVTNLCNTCYEFSAYMANIFKPSNSTKPNVRFEVRSADDENVLLAQNSTGDISEYPIMNWHKYSVIFNASVSSVTLLLISNVKNDFGNDLVIDDIELKPCSFKSSPPTTTFSTYCKKPDFIGTACSIPIDLCSMLQPCGNRGNCTSKNSYDYNCSCQQGFNGTRCEKDYRFYKSNDSLNTPINHCIDNPCKNKGICRSFEHNYKCYCLSDSYSSQHCENVSKKIIRHRIYAKIIASFAIFILLVFALFIIIMDILKYGFGIDPVAEDREYLRRKRQEKKRKPRQIQRPVYVNGLFSKTSTDTTTVSV